MYKSVKNNGGFYIGRYETGVLGETPKTWTEYETYSKANVETETAKLVVKKGVQAYQYVLWGKSMNDISADKVNHGPDPTYIIGAVELARNFASVKGYDTTKVHSTLCYGVQWDTALNFIDPGYTGYAKDSTGMGWHSDNYNSTTNGNTKSNPNLMTGEDLIYSTEPGVVKNKQKNIYDMAGNVWEWTMEAYETTNRVIRGGGITNLGTDYSASIRIYTDPWNCYNGIGMRLALYVE